MATDFDGVYGTFPASADLSAFFLCGVTLNASGELIAPTAGGQIIGVLQTKPSVAGQSGTVMLVGPISRGKAGATPAAIGQSVKVTVAGAFILAAATDKAVGILVEAGANNEECAVMLLPHIAV